MDDVELLDYLFPAKEGYTWIELAERLQQLNESELEALNELRQDPGLSFLPNDAGKIRPVLAELEVDMLAS